MGGGRQVAAPTGARMGEGFQMKDRLISVGLVVALVLLHLFASSVRPISLGNAIYTVVYLCVWGLFLWHSVRIRSRVLLTLYQVFWLLLMVSFPLAILTFGIGWRRLLPRGLDFIAYVFMRGWDDLFLPLRGLELIPGDGFIFGIVIFSFPLLMLLVGTIAKWRLL